MNPYLIRLRSQYDGLRTSIEGLQTRAAGENRDLTENELTAVTEQGEQARALAEQITSLTQIEARNAEVAALAADVHDNIRDTASGTEQNRTGERLTGAAQTRERDPGHYRSEAAGGRYSFFGDLFHARERQDDSAQTRLTEHNRALATGGAGVGIVAPHWLIEEYDPLARQGRLLANAVRPIALGNDPRPLTLPRQTTGTDAIVTEQAAENNAVLESDAFGTAVDTVVPKPTSGIQIVSRQMIEMSSPAIDALIYGDMLAAYNDKIEAKVGAALIAAAGAPVATAPVMLTEAAFTTDDAQDAVVEIAMAVWSARKRPADVLAMSVSRWGKFKKLRDTTGRPLIPTSSGGPMNVAGVGSVVAVGEIEGLAVIATDGIGIGYPDSVLALRASDTLLFETPTQTFSYEQPLGPQSVKFGIWGYSAVLVRQAGKSVKRFVVTAAS